MKNSALLFLCLSGVSAFSQTKLIAYKSHGGNMNHFTEAVSEDKFDANFSNLGLPAIQGKIDSVIIENDKAFVISRSGRFNLDKRNVDTLKIENPSKKKSENFYKRNNIEQTVKEELMKNKSCGCYLEPDSSTVYLKYNPENKTYINLKNETEKPQKEKKEKSKSGLLLGILMVSGLSGLYSWKRSLKKSEN